MAEPRYENPLDMLAASSRPSEAVQLRLVQARSRLSFRTRDDAAIAAADDITGTPLPRLACRFSENDDRRALWLGPDEWLLTAPLAQGPDLHEKLVKALKPFAHSLVDVSHRSVSFSVSGPMAARIINSGCPLDLGNTAFPIGGCTRTVLAKTEILLLRSGEEHYHIDVWRSFAPYAWNYLEEARREYIG
ncbi:sarcosine oxidase subunit gamma [Aureimonas fodinaquatilis]|uniref:Sarcosine oxidase subunit gamma n=1 Tax=Aureimonas fodinaquatilis TaxID=2565783 RepID=A0A5B0E457_9HYPH|nr:sarcosine oxidase subunit gamma family protein [Aureimonas fodinaquatilis]KAA0972550.1 sarcosine oxidase subunit gamma [Aureimonas fodinaquatilis]